jgi:penicillin amidase
LIAIRRSLALLFTLVAVACGRAAPPPPPPPLPQITGSIVVGGLTASVRIVRDRVGVPHIYASNTKDLFFAQGFVQAQDRLFQMDLWRRAAQGRLSEILGANFIDRDAMTRRIQYHGDAAAEWASYGPDTRAIAEAFVAGINAWVSISRTSLPQEFVVVRWPPAYWRAEDLLNRTDAFLESSGALDDVRRRHLPDVVADAIHLVGTAPFLAGSTTPDAQMRTQTTTRADAARGRLDGSETPGILTVPATRYLVHLVAPGWNVIGATAPWLPGVAVGHNGRVAWAMEPVAVDTQHVIVEPADAITTKDPDLMRIKGRPEMLPFTRDSTAEGIVIASDRERQRVFVLKWRGFEPGAAAGLGALALDRADDWASFREAANRWQMPARRIVYVDVDGRVEHIDAVPDRSESRAGPSGPGSRADSALFRHLIQRFDVGPLRRPRDDAPLQFAIDPTSWDRSRAINAPGQSGAPTSPHYADAAKAWSAGEQFSLFFSEEAVGANAEATLTLTPAPGR